MGTEKFGVSQEALELADDEIVIPMLGMSQSLNVSVATALILYEAQRQRALAGMYEPNTLDASPWKELAERWVQRDLDRRKNPLPAEAGPTIQG